MRARVCVFVCLCVCTFIGYEWSINRTVSHYNLGPRPWSRDRGVNRQDDSFCVKALIAG